jgi:hypothetical protein
VGYSTYIAKKANNMYLSGIAVRKRMILYVGFE